MKSKKIIKIAKGFTLIEMLLVIAIIGILAAVVFAMIGNSDNSKRKAALSTTRSILTYAQECYFLKSGLNEPNNTQTGGGNICDESITPWPELSVEECDYSVTAGSYDYTVTCPDIGANIECNSENGTCKEVLTGS